MFLQYLLTWFPIILIAFANATVRDSVYGKYVGELAAHQISSHCSLKGWLWMSSER